ncbi:MAG: P-II family nitrogen regulator [Paucibacter sp.]|nr:P-II family nitrogen regulator [Roseateles sp.]
MKLITAIIKPFKLEAVKNALLGAGIGGLSVMEMKGFGRQRGNSELYRGAEYAVDFMPKVRVEVAVREEDVDRVAGLIMQEARTGKVGDGKIFVTAIDKVFSIRTGETNEAAF